jgi:hypothetical protein
VDVRRKAILIRPCLYKLGWLILIAACLGGCGRLVPNLFVPEPYSKDVPYPNATTFNFDQYVRFAQNAADKWEPQAKLNSINRQTSCNNAELTAGQQILFRYWRPQLYWFGPRIEWFEVVIFPEEPLASLETWTSLNTTWDQPPVDLAALTIDYTTAMKLAQGRGGAAYTASHPTCFLSMALEENKWYFLFKEDPWMLSNDVLHLCIDGRTGEPCELPVEATSFGVKPAIIVTARACTIKT